MYNYLKHKSHRVFNDSSTSFDKYICIEKYKLKDILKTTYQNKATHVKKRRNSEIKAKYKEEN